MRNNVDGFVEIDFRPFGRQIERCPVEIQFDKSGRPSRTDIGIANKALWNQLTDRQQDHFRFLNGTMIRGATSDGAVLSIDVGTARELTIAGNGEIVFGVEPRSVTLDRSGHGLNVVGAHWQFRLVNFGFSVGDIASLGQKPRGYENDSSVGVGRSLDRIDFGMAGREWSLKDNALAPQMAPAHDVDEMRAEAYRYILAREHAAPGKMPSRRAIKAAFGLICIEGRRFFSQRFQRQQHEPSAPSKTGSGLLLVSAQEGESAESIQLSARDITTLLSFALCTTVDWSECALVTDAGEEIWMQSRHARLARFEPGQSRIDQAPPQRGGVIRDFLEQTHPRFAANRDKLMQEIGVYVEAQLADSTLEKAALLNMLLDRLQKRINGKRFPAQIDSELDKRLDQKEVQDRITAMFQGVTGKWTSEITKKVIGEIKRFNAGPGFGKAVRLAFESLGIRGFEKLPLGARHDILHGADLPFSVDEVIPYLTELDLLVFLLIARMLGYTGQFTHPHLRNEAIRIDSLLT